MKMVEITEKLIKDLYSRFVPCGDAEDVICHLKDIMKKGEFEELDF